MKAIILLNQFGDDATEFVNKLKGFNLSHVMAKTEHGPAVVIDEKQTLEVAEATAFDFKYGILPLEVFRAAVAASVGATNK